MPKNKNNPTRMCIVCRERFPQYSLLRLQCVEKILRTFLNEGRSFYLCPTCVEDEKKAVKSLMRQCKTGDMTALSNQLKEIVATTWKK